MSHGVVLLKNRYITYMECSIYIKCTVYNENIPMYCVRYIILYVVHCMSYNECFTVYGNCMTWTVQTICRNVHHFTVCRMLYVHHMLYAVHCILYTLQCTVYNVGITLCIIQCIVQCTSYTIHRTIYTYTTLHICIWLYVVHICIKCMPCVYRCTTM